MWALMIAADDSVSESGGICSKVDSFSGNTIKVIKTFHANYSILKIIAKTTSAITTF